MIAFLTGTLLLIGHDSHAPSAPTPGHVVVLNALTPSGGGCVGNVSVLYTQLVLDSPAEVVMTGDAGCTLSVAYQTTDAPGVQLNLGDLLRMHPSIRVWTNAGGQGLSERFYANSSYDRTGCPTKILPTLAEPQNGAGYVRDNTPYDIPADGCGYFSGNRWERDLLQPDRDYVQVNSWAHSGGTFGCSYGENHSTQTAAAVVELTCDWAKTDLRVLGSAVLLGYAPNDGAPHDFLRGG